MSSKLDDLANRILEAVADLDRDSASKRCDELIRELQAQRPGADAEKPVNKVLQGLRRKRFFAPMGSLARVFLDQIPGESPKIQLQLIQALIDQGNLMGAQYELMDLAELHSLTTWAGAEARGLLGRVHKQAYVNARQRKGAVRRSLREAIHDYLRVYRENPSQHWWQGINAVACLARAERDGIPKDQLFDLLDSVPDWKAESEKILKATAAYPKGHGDYTWAMATAMEACVALQRLEEANDFCERYINTPGADVFELGSTERQLREVWELDSRNVPGSQVLNIVQGRLGVLGGIVESLIRADLQYQAQLGSESSRAVLWLDNLLKRAASVARIHKETDDTAGGTGFLVKQGDLDDSGSDRLVIMTNYHVVNENGDSGAFAREAAVVKLTRSHGERVFPLGRVLWSSPMDQLDVTVCAFDLPKQSPETRLWLPIGRRGDLDKGGPKPRLYVVGHARGAPLQISLYDNHLIEMDETRVRYRSPTDDGSSGSPVLTEDLAVVAVHHATRTAEPANQGVLLDSIRASIIGSGGFMKEDRR